MTAQPLAVAPLLVFGWGNLSRGDDALGPMCIERLRATARPVAEVDFLDDYQLQIEHALDLVGRSRVLFVDASLSCPAPFEVTALSARPEAGCTSHALSPQALLQLFRELRGEAPPPATLLAIRGQRFELGAPPSAAALANLDLALAWCNCWLTSSSDTTCVPAQHFGQQQRPVLPAPAQQPQQQRWPAAGEAEQPA